MSYPLQKHREIVFQMLYALVFSGKCEDEMIPMMTKVAKISRKNAYQALDQAKKIFVLINQIDQWIIQVSKEYAIDRIQSVEKTILRLAIYEMLFEKLLPFKVCCAEAVRLTKKFSTSQSASYINAILDAVYHEYCRQESSQD